MPDDIQRDPRVYFAAERNLLAWIRTGLALLGGGFAMSRFGLYLRQIELAQDPHFQSSTHGVFVWGGAALIALGILVNLFSVSSYLRIVRALNEGNWLPGRPSREGIALAIILAVMGTATAVYVIIVR
jgi:putative membrane protein